MKLIILLLLGLSVPILAQEKPYPIKSTKSFFKVTIGDRFRWFTLDESTKTNVIDLDLAGGKQRELIINTDVDSLDLNLETGHTYDFIVEMNGRLFPQQFVVHNVSKNVLRARSVLSGNPQDVNPKLFGPVLDLDGGDAALGGMQSTIDKVRGCSNCSTKVDVVFISVSPADREDPFLSSIGLDKGSKLGAELYAKRLSQVNGVDSVEVISFYDLSTKVSEQALQAIEKAEVVFINGGSQCDYLNVIRGTAVQKAIEDVYKRGGAVGGSSAGDAVQGKYIFDGCTIKEPVTSIMALADPYNPNISFSNDLFSWKFLDNTITDQHLVKRDRIGRTFAFLARQLVDHKLTRVYAIASDQEASVVIDKNGLATVAGTANAYFITADHKPEVCEKRKPLTYSNFKVWKVTPGGTFNLKKRPTTGYYTVSVKEGKLDRDPY